ncbi:hypothetical protein [Natronogracilivirga saccharolytica]|uniref:Uncharacterized protein n=1 Tax=Natronogracilivirga saccharolytica TaxID=2812953 RepID=A0A8J7S5I7_9BACT|nr:hypothetical protein [Natronogracilivirga saccharolytica]MBP3192358.1 hypothetical protein [Natronogracilivirga saccharolytica]
MNTALSHSILKPDNAASQNVIPEGERMASLSDGRNSRRLSLIFESHTQQADVFDLIGWSDLPDSLKMVVRTDMEAYRDELLGLYSTCDRNVQRRRKSVSYWVKAYRDGICSLQTAVSALS